MEDTLNTYAQLLKEQGNYVINVGGVDWYGYSGFMLPAYLPHCCPNITAEMAKEVIRISGRLFARWDTKFNQVENSQWWHIIRRGPWAIDDIKDRSKRSKIRKGKKNFIVRPLTFEEILNDCPRITQLAAARYKTKTKLETPETFKKSVDASKKIPGVIEYIGCFHDDVLASFSENYIQGNAVFCNIIRHDPAFLKKNSSYALIDGMLNYYLNEKKFEYLSNGSRNLYHKTEFHDHLISVFGYVAEYSILNVVYVPWFKGLLNCVYPLRNILCLVNAKWKNPTLDKIIALSKQESIRRACKAL